MDTQGDPINGREQRRSRIAAGAERARLGFEARVAWPLGDALGHLRELAGRALEWVAWVLRRGLVWPLQDRAAALGTPARVASVLAAALVVGLGAALIAGAGSGDDPGSEPAAVAVAPLPAPEPEPAPTPAPEQPPAPTLQGAAPVFKPSKGKRQAGAVKQAKAVAGAPRGEEDAATATIGSDPRAKSAGAGNGGGATASSAPSRQSSPAVEGPPAGPAAIAVAREFADAFVLYETGAEADAVRKAFAHSASPELAKALLRRPPRQPANVEVPRAKVLNVVAGPSRAGIYPVSVSLLRVGLTSELRLDLERLAKGKRWRVTNVLG